MEKYDDVSNLTYLNDASVLWNLKTRYQAKLIYVRIRCANGIFIFLKMISVQFNNFNESDAVCFCSLFSCKHFLKELISLYIPTKNLF